LAKQVAAAGFMLSRCESASEIGGANGVTDFSARTVVVRADVSDAQACKTLAHELGHILLGHESGSHARGVAEVEAESVAYVVAGAAGLASEAYSLAYVGGWARGDSQACRKSAERVLRVAGAIVAGLEDVSS
jgi:hypothetical protein